MHYLAVYSPRRHQQVPFPKGLVTLGTDPPRANPFIHSDDSLLAPWQLVLCRHGRHEVRLQNLGEAPLHVQGRVVAGGQELIVRMPVTFRVGQTYCQAFEIPDAEYDPATVAWLPSLGESRPTSDRVDKEAIAAGLLAWGADDALASWVEPWVESAELATLAGVASHGEAVAPSPAPRTLARWLRALSAIHRRTAASSEFFQDAVRAVVEVGGLDAAMFLVREHGNWQVRNSHVAQLPLGIAFDPRLVDLAARSRQSVFQGTPSAAANGAPNHVGVGFASPIFDHQGQVLGVLYASRHTTQRNRRQRIRGLEAFWTQVIAESITSGVVRLQHETDAARRRVLLEQTFPREIVRRLEHAPGRFLDPEEREVTILFADLFDSSLLTERLGPSDTYQFLSDVMDMMTRAVEWQGGVIVDYYGDGLVAMWNAPIDQPDHATRACRTAMRIVTDRVSLDAVWRARLGESARLGVGVHTGTAWVGNAGSQTRWKYGPRGVCVNVASRIEKATRKLHVPILISAATRRRLPPGSAVQRMGTVRLKGLDAPLTLYGLHSVDAQTIDQQLCDRLADYEWALRLLEQHRYEESLALLERLTCDDRSPVSLEFLREQLEQRLPAIESLYEGVC